MQAIRNTSLFDRLSDHRITPQPHFPPCSSLKWMKTVQAPQDVSP